MKSEKETLFILAHYHKWAYQQLFMSLKDISDQDYRENCGLFFQSIHGTLNHLLLIDRLWLSRYTNVPYQVSGLDDELENNRELLQETLIQQATCWISFIENIDERSLNGNLTYFNTRGEKKDLLYKAVITHVFNHGTHHRGQISTIITQLKKPPPMMDLAFFKPAVERESRATLLSSVGRANNSEFFKAIKNGNYVVVETLLQINAALVLSTSDSLSALHFAARAGNKEMITLLLLKGANISCKDIKGRTALHYAYKYNKFDVGCFLVHHKEDIIDAQDNKGETALYYAAYTNNINAVRALLSLNASADMCNFQGMTPKEATHDEDIKKLLSKNTYDNDMPQSVLNQVTTSPESSEGIARSSQATVSQQLFTYTPQ